MAIALGDNIQTGAPKPTDSRYLNNQVPYTGETEVNTLITGGVGGVRYTGLTVNIGGTEYWYKEGIGDEDLIEKTSSGGGSSNLAWTGSTANAIGTYMSVSGICAQSGLTFDGTTLSVSGAIDGNSTLDILGATCLHDTLAVTGATSLSAVASYLTDLSPFTARQIPDAEWVTGQTNAVCLGWSNLISGSIVAGCGTIASGTSECNTFYGVCAGQDITNGSDNVGIGFSVLANTTTGNHNIGMGYDALGLNVSGHCNIGIGYQAIKANTSGFGNVGVGIKALCKNTTGVVNVAIGYQSMQVHTTGSENTSIGYMAMAATTGGSCNTAIGTQSLAKNTGGEANIAIGYMAMCGNLLAGCNIGIGVKTMSSINTGVENIAIGKWALCENLGGSNGVAIGASALQENTTGDGNVAIGQCAGAINTIGSNNVFIGRCAGYSETGSSKLHIGNCADCSLIYGDFTGKTVIIDDKLSTCKLQVTSGASSGCVLTSDASGNATWQTGGGGISGIGWSNLANGSTVAGCGTTVSGGTPYLCHSTTYGVEAAVSGGTGDPYARGQDNVAIGYRALYSNVTRSENTAVGTQALYANYNGSANTALGYQTLYFNCVGGSNVAIGANALRANRCGGANVAVGTGALDAKTCGDYNVGIGDGAFGGNTTGSTNTALGYRAGSSNISGSSNVFLGRYAGYSETGSDRLHIAISNTCSLIYGEFDNKLVCIDDALVTCCFQMLSGASDGCVLTSDASGNATWETGGGAGTITGGINGLSTSGTNVILGGDLTGNTSIGGDWTKTFTITGISTGLFQSDGAMAICSSSGSLTMHACSSGFVVGIGGTIYNDNGQSGTKGIFYNDDYNASSSNPRWLPDAEWVTGQTSSAVTIGSTGQIPYSDTGTPGTDFVYDANFIYSGGKLGIGTTSPDNKFHVMKTDASATSHSNAIITLENSGTTALQLLSPNDQIQYIMFGDPESSAVGYIRYNHDTNDMVFRAGNQSDQMTLFSTGEIGVGIKTAEHAFSVDGIISNSNSQGIITNWKSTRSDPTNLKFYKVGEVVLTTSYQMYQGIFMVQASKITSTDLDTTTIFKLFASAENSMTGALVSLHHVSSTSHSGEEIEVKAILTTDDGAEKVIELYAGGINATYVYYNFSILSQSTDIGGSFNITEGDSGVIEASLPTGTTDTLIPGLHTLSSGNVGIGTASPTQLLNVSSTDDGSKILAQTYISTVGKYTGMLLKVSANITDEYKKGGILFERTGVAVGKLHLVNDIVVDAGNAGLADAKLTIDDTGYIGIGTASPDKLLEISADTDATLRITSTDIPLDVPINLGLIEFYGSSTYAPGAGVKAQIAIVSDSYGDDAHMDFYTSDGTAANNQFRMTIAGGGNVGIGTISPNYQLELSSDSAGKPGAGGLWTIVSDSRLKENIVLADLDRSYEIVKTLPLKHFTWKDSTYTPEQVRDRSSLGWIAEDVQKVFPKAVGVKEFNLLTKTSSGTEQYEEQDYIIETGITTTTEIQVISGTPIQITRTGITENKVMLFDDVEVKDISGNTIYTNKNVETFDASGNTITTVEKAPLIHSVPRMITKTRIKYIQDTIPDCLDLNTGQVYTVMYGALQKTMEMLEDALIKLENALERIDVLEN